ncbi:MAG TPA: MFS transporter [Ktedonobacteraceae bacterium]|nr:MFS transporter [Ktedonobacteraceae bacterium]
MPVRSASISAPASRLASDFWKFWAGQSISSFGSSFTLFALPLLTFKLTHSALNLALTMAAGYLPYLLFGLLIGAWVDRVNRKKLMIFTDIIRALLIASIPLMATLNLLSVWWIYGIAFVSTVLSIGFNAAQFAAIPSLVGRDNLVTANGRIQASFSAATVLGPFLAGLLVAIIPVASILLFDALSFLISAVSLALIRVSFNPDGEDEEQQSNIWQDINEGLRYVLGHPVLRAIAIMMALVNLVATTTSAQLVFFAKYQLQASNTQVALLYTASAVGITCLSLSAGFLRKRGSFSVVALGALMLDGLVTVIFSLMHWFWLALPLWGLIAGLAMLFNINTNSLRQTIVPNHMLGRVMTVASVLAWSAIPIGTILGGTIIDHVKNVALVYGVIGGIIILLPLAFSFTALGHADRYLPKPSSAQVTE